MENDNLKEVRFDKYCSTCKHDEEYGKLNDHIGHYDGKEWTGLITKEEYIPCCFCLEEGAREGTEVPVEWEEK